MAEISLSGLASGMDTASIIDQLMKVEQRKITLLNNNLGKYSDKKTAITELQSKVSSFKSALGNLSSLNKLKAFNTSTGDADILTASASATATEGSHTVQIKQLATAERIVHNGGFSSASSLVGKGTFIYSYNHQEVVVPTTPETTLQELVTKINADSNNPGVSASLLEYDDGSGRWHLVLAGKDTGAENTITINDFNTELKTSHNKLTLKSGGNNATATTRIKDLADLAGTTSITITGTKRNSDAVSVAIPINSYTTVEDLMDRIEAAYGDQVYVTIDEGYLKVTDTANGVSNMTIALSYTGGTTPGTLNFDTSVDGGSQEATLDNFAGTTFTRTQEAKDAKIKVDGYPKDIVDAGTGKVTQENWISRSTNTVSDIIAGVTLSLQSTSETAPGSEVYNSISVSLTRNTATVKENLNAMISAYNAIVNYIDEKTTYDTDKKQMGILSDSYSISSISTLITSPLRSLAGGFTSSDAFTTPTDIGLKVNADGLLELDSSTFDEAVSDDYAAVLNLIGAQQVGSSFGGDSAYVSFDAANQYTDAGSYDVEVVKDDEGRVSALIKLTSEDWSQAREMKVSGNTLYGNNERAASGSPLHPEYSLVLALDPNIANGKKMSTTVNVRQGFGDKLYDMVSEMLKSKGRIDLAKTSITSQISTQQDRIDKEATRLEKYKQSLQSKYARLEATLNSIQQQMASVNAMT
jgi:flagellar hook-associated protein 2